MYGIALTGVVHYYGFRLLRQNNTVKRLPGRFFVGPILSGEQCWTDDGESRNEKSARGRFFYFECS